MCARFTLHTPADVIGEEFGLAAVPAIPPRYNIAPSSLIPAVGVRQDGTRGLTFFKWGLVPRWAPDLTGPAPVNAKAETAAELPTFRDAFRHRRCLVIADGFYEWRPGAGGKDPFHFRLKTGRPFAFAGLWDCWRGNGVTLHTVGIITTAPNSLVGEVHGRRPVILPADAYGRWMNRAVTDPAELRGLLAPLPAELMARTAVARTVNNARNEGPDLLPSVANPAALSPN